MPEFSAPDMDEAKRAQRQGFDDDELSDAWCRWSPQLARLLEECTDAVVREAALEPGQRVLDLASGTGEPAFALARAVAPDGRVIGTDIAEDMLRCARRRAREMGIDNVEFQQGDAHCLPFSEASFDAITCRFGIMFFADPVATLRNIRSLLRPGGRVVLVAWGSPEQPYFACTRGLVEKRAPQPAHSKAANTFRFADPRRLLEVLGQAGFSDVVDRSTPIELCWPGSPENLWRFMQELTPSFQDLARQLADEWSGITEEVLRALRPYVHEGTIRMPADINIAVARQGSGQE